MTKGKLDNASSQRQPYFGITSIANSTSSVPPKPQNI